MPLVTLLVLAILWLLALGAVEDFKEKHNIGQGKSDSSAAWGSTCSHCGSDALLEHSGLCYSCDESDRMYKQD